MISNDAANEIDCARCRVSIPNGDKHDFKPGPETSRRSNPDVSIPNGDKHDFKPRVGDHVTQNTCRFQSPMGISMISNSTTSARSVLFFMVSIPNGDKHDFKLQRHTRPTAGVKVSIPNGDKHDFKRGWPLVNFDTTTVSIPNGDKHDFKLEDDVAYYPGYGRFNPQWG